MTPEPTGAAPPQQQQQTQTVAAAQPPPSSPPPSRMSAAARPAPTKPPSHSSSLSSTWSRLGTDEMQNPGGGPGLDSGNNTGLWSLLTAASKYNAFEEEDDDSVRSFVHSSPCFPFVSARIVSLCDRRCPVGHTSAVFCSEAAARHFL